MKGGKIMDGKGGTVLIGLGTDIIEIKRIERVMQRPAFSKRIFTESERAWLQTKGKNLSQSAAGLFCAKEAVAKALGTGFSDGLCFCDIEISHTQQGMPVVVRPHGRFLLSIAHCQTYAVATAILLEEGELHAGD